jgi:hypothetical protein
MNGFDLVPEEIKRRVRLRTLGYGIAICLGAMVACSAGAYLWVDKAYPVIDLTGLIDKRQRLESEVEEALEQKQGLSERLSVLQAQLYHQRFFSDMLIELSAIARQRVWLKNFWFQGTHKRFSIQGYSTDLTLLGEFLEGLKRIPTFKDIEVSSRDVKVDEQTLVSFEVKGALQR